MSNSINKPNVPRRADASPNAAYLIEGLRDIGYSLETAISDIIDNSITAQSKNIEILSDAYIDNPYIAIIDDGTGMTENELISAMRPGSKNPLSERAEKDLGRFGLGLKSASFSQCRKLTVVTKKDDKKSIAVWDLDDIAERNEWSLQLLDDDTGIPGAEKLEKTGTLVVWQNLDRLPHINKETKKKNDLFNQRIADVERHIRLIFHRYISDAKVLRILINGRPIKPIDPFAQKNPATISDPEEEFKFKNGVMKIKSYTLPHHKQMTNAEWEELGGVEGHLKTQGFYIYRAKRLILYGTWFGLCRQTELTKLSRIRIDIPNGLDSDWKIDVKKSSAQLPHEVRDRLKNIIERIQSGSKKTYHKVGQKLVDTERYPVWSRIQVDGKIKYTPNLKHPVIDDLLKKIPDNYKCLILNCIAFIGASLPIDALYADMAGMSENIEPSEIDKAALEQVLKTIMQAFLSAKKTKQEIFDLLKNVEPFRSSWKETQYFIEQIIED